MLTLKRVWLWSNMEVVVTHREEEEDDVLHWSRVVKGWYLFGFGFEFGFLFWVYYLLHFWFAFWCLWLMWVLFCFSIYFFLCYGWEAMEENLCRDNYGDQPSFRVLEVSSCRTSFSGYLFRSSSSLHVDLLPNHRYHIFDSLLFILVGL